MWLLKTMDLRVELTQEEINGLLGKDSSEISDGDHRLPRVKASHFDLISEDTWIDFMAVVLQAKDMSFLDDAQIEELRQGFEFDLIVNCCSSKGFTFNKIPPAFSSKFDKRDILRAILRKDLNQLKTKEKMTILHYIYEEKNNRNKVSRFHRQ